VRRAIASLCCIVVGLQLLFCVPLLLGVAFLFVAHKTAISPINIEIRFGKAEPQVTPLSSPIAGLPGADRPSELADILESRTQRGNLFAGTALADPSAPSGDQSDFVAALQRVAAADSRAAPSSPIAESPAETRPASEPADDSGNAVR
jgi:hypothetical protein